MDVHERRDRVRYLEFGGFRQVSDEMESGGWSKSVVGGDVRRAVFVGQWEVSPCCGVVWVQRQ